MNNDFELPADVKEQFLFKDIKKPSEWAEKEFKLGKGYGEQGQFSFDGREWQRDIVDAPLYYKTVIVCKPVQIGGSLCAIDVPWAWWNKFVGGRSLIVYADKDTSEDVFEERIKDNIKNNLPDIWSGLEDDLRREKIILNNGISRCGSANIENDFATFPASLVCLDEVSKYKSNFDVIGAARGRQKSYKGIPGYHGILIIVSSPKRHGDPLYNEIHGGGVLVLRCQFPCPRCGEYHELMDENIKELPNDKGEYDHNPTRIRLDGAAVYECPKCKGVIADIDRWKMLPKYRWVADDEVVAKDGQIKNENSLRYKSDSVCFWPNRLVSMPDKFTFADCLSAFFTARQSVDPKAWETYWNEDMARFINPRTEKVSYSHLMQKCGDYLQYSEQARLPNEVVILFAGIDTQDDGFYFVVRGFGHGMESWLVREGFIHCDMKESVNHDPRVVLEIIRRGILQPRYLKKDGTEIGIYAGFIDEGGHRQRDVHFICRHIPIFRAYKGSSSPNSDSIKKSEKGEHYMGNTRQLSELVQKYMESSTWHLPNDITKTYLEQVVKQYWEEEKDRHGNIKYKWVSGNNDHYRDCENYVMGLVLLNNLAERLNDTERIEQLKRAVDKKTGDVVSLVSTQEKLHEINKTTAPRRVDPTSYRDKLRSGRRFI